MDLYTLDFETYYGDEYTLSKLTTEAYVRDPRFETILVGIQKNDAEPYWVPKPKVAAHLKSLCLEEHAVLMHHAHFDALVLNYHYGIRPKRLLDTLGMARALYGAHGKLSLEKLNMRHGLPPKGTEVHNVRGMHFQDFTAEGLTRYGDYCLIDVVSTRKNFDIMLPQFPGSELRLNDWVIRCFTEPLLRGDTLSLAQYHDKVKRDKVQALADAKLDLKDVRSDVKFAAILESLGIDPPTKLNKKGETKFAFAKTDPAMQELAEHEDLQVQAVVATRLKVKTTIEESRAKRLLDMSERGPMCVYYKLSGTGTDRLSGGDGTNFQNLGRGGPLRDCIESPPGYVLCVADSSNIEARLLDYVSGQDDALEEYHRYDRGEGPDVYCVTAEAIYNRSIGKETDPQERQVGKVVKLGSGYGMGAGKLQKTARAQAKDKAGRPLVLTLEESTLAIKGYRRKQFKVPELWDRFGRALECISRGIVGKPVDPRGIILTCKDGLLLPNGRPILYPSLQRDMKGHWSYWGGMKRESIWGGAMTGHIIQALAAILVMKVQSMEINRYYPVKMSSHDEAVAVVPEGESDRCLQLMGKIMRTPPVWAPELPLNVSLGAHRIYGKAKR